MCCLIAYGANFNQEESLLNKLHPLLSNTILFCYSLFKAFFIFLYLLILCVSVELSNLLHMFGVSNTLMGILSIVVY